MALPCNGDTKVEGVSILSPVYMMRPYVLSHWTEAGAAQVYGAGIGSI